MSATARRLLSDETPAVAGKTLVSRRRNRHTGAEVAVYRLGVVSRGRKQSDVDQTPWLVVCRSHSFATRVAGRREAWDVAGAPFGWCDECHRIMLGEAAKVEDDSLTNGGSR